MPYLAHEAQKSEVDIFWTDMPGYPKTCEIQLRVTRRMGRSRLRKGQGGMRK
jgi:hypothetical protein